MQFERCNLQDAICKMQFASFNVAFLELQFCKTQLDRPAGQIRRTDQLGRQINQLASSARRISLVQFCFFKAFVSLHVCTLSQPLSPTKALFFHSVAVSGYQYRPNKLTLLQQASFVKIPSLSRILLFWQCNIPAISGRIFEGVKRKVGHIKPYNLNKGRILTTTSLCPPNSLNRRCWWLAVLSAKVKGFVSSVS